MAAPSTLCTFVVPAARLGVPAAWLRFATRAIFNHQVFGSAATSLAVEKANAEITAANGARLPITLSKHTLVGIGRMSADGADAYKHVSRSSNR